MVSLEMEMRLALALIGAAIMSASPALASDETDACGLKAA